jgi:hypothetical protein
MKRLLFLLALPLALSALSLNANARDQDSASAKSTPPNSRDPKGEFQYARDMAQRVHDQMAQYGTNRHIRDQVRKVDAEILQINEAIRSRKFDWNQIHATVARIDDELHSVDLEIRDLSIHEPTKLSGGKASLAR